MPDFQNYAPRFFWDPSTDRMYVQVSLKPVTRQERISERCTEDFDEAGDFVGVELWFPAGFTAGQRGRAEPPGSSQPPSSAALRPAPPCPPNVDPNPKAQKAGSTNARKGSTRLPPTWTPNERLLEWAAANTPEVDVAFEVQCFQDYWWASAKATSFKKDWDAAFRQWLRIASGRKPRGRTAQSTQEATADRKARETQELKKFFRGET